MTGPPPPPECDIRLDGTLLRSDARRDVRSVTVQQVVGYPTWFSVELSNWDSLSQRPAWSEGDLFEVGGTVELRLGRLGAAEPVLDGEITSIEPVFSATDPPVLTVGGYDRGHRLTRSRRTRSFLGMTDSAIADQLAREAKLGARVVDTRLKHDYVAQANMTDWAFLRERAARIGYELYVTAGELVFAPLADPPGSEAARPLVVGREISEFRVRLSAFDPVGEVVVRGWDVARKQALVGRAEANDAEGWWKWPGSMAADKAFGPSSTTLVGLAPRTKDEADRIALGALNEAELRYVHGTADCAGDPALRPGTVVEIENVGKRFSGLYYVTAAAHSLDAAGYRSVLTVRRGDI